MFSRRHPFLYYSIIMSSLFVVLILGTATIFSLSSSIVSKNILSRQFDSEANVGIVEISGIISSSKKAIKAIKEFRKEDSIKAIIVRINSPGGGIGPSQEIYTEIMRTRGEKPIIASLGSVAASGGYYIASATQKIVANPGTITGSIGVIVEYTNIQEVLKKIGLSAVVIKSGKFKDIGSPVRDITDAEKEFLQNFVDELHMQFVNHAAEGRGLDAEVMAKLADGRIYTGQTAMELNLIDQLGNFEDSIQLAGEMAGIEGEVIPVYPKQDRMSLFKELTQSLIQSLFKDINITSAVSDNFRYIIN
ncbi:MAG: signal peptide peptidase SppA [Desulfobacteraceae bacterium]|nr:signal peptide peptidase SppA [Desulfobacteraceae bacterium]